MGLLNGNILTFSSVKKYLGSLFSPLSTAALNARTTLMKNACFFISLISSKVSYYEEIDNYIQLRLTRLSHGANFIAECSKLIILAIVRYSYSKRV
jgi:hypothetical protein